MSSQDLSPTCRGGEMHGTDESDAKNRAIVRWGFGGPDWLWIQTSWLSILSNLKELDFNCQHGGKGLLPFLEQGSVVFSSVTGQPARRHSYGRSEKFTERVLSVSPDTGKAREFELAYVLPYRFVDADGKALISWLDRCYATTCSTLTKLSAKAANAVCSDAKCVATQCCNCCVEWNPRRVSAAPICGTQPAVNASQFLNGLSRQLPSVTLLHGDEPLQLGECLDALREAARAQGVNERISFDAITGFDWSDLGASADNFSLFAERRLFGTFVGSPRCGRGERRTDGAVPMIFWSSFVRGSTGRRCARLGSKNSTRWRCVSGYTRFKLMRCPVVGRAFCADRHSRKPRGVRTAGRTGEYSLPPKVDKLVLLSEVRAWWMSTRSPQLQPIVLDSMPSTWWTPLLTATRHTACPTLRAEYGLPPLLGSVTWMIRNLLSVRKKWGEASGCGAQPRAVWRLGRRSAGVRRGESSGRWRSQLARRCSPSRPVHQRPECGRPWSALERMCLDLAANALAEPIRASRPGTV